MLVRPPRSTSGPLSSSPSEKERAAPSSLFSVTVLTGKSICTINANCG